MRRKAVSAVRVAAHLVTRVEPIALSEALRQAKRHRRVVRPVPRRQVETSAAGQVVERRETPGRLELEGNAERVADGEAEDRSEAAILDGLTHQYCSVAATDA